MDDLISRFKRFAPAFGVGIGLMVGAACGDSTGDVAAKGAAAAAPPQAPRPIEVVLASARDGGLAVSQRFLGRCEAAMAATIAPGVSGTVLSVTGHEGDVVAQGAVLVTLDEALITPRLSVANAEIRRLTAERRLAKSELDRARKLAAPVVTAAELERFESRVSVLDAQLGAARAAVATLEAERERHTMTAPFDAMVRVRHVDPGTWVNPGTPLIELVSNGTPEVFVEIPPNLARRLQRGDKLTVLSEPAVEAEILGVVSALDATTRSATVRLRPVEARPWLMPGRTVEVRFDLTDTAPDAVIVPRDALKRGPVSTRVFLVDESAGKAPFPTKLVDVEVLATSDAEALVRGEGLVGSSRVVTRGNDRLRPGQMVTEAPGAGGDKP